jgi:hypothetical protein
MMGRHDVMDQPIDGPSRHVSGVVDRHGWRKRSKGAPDDLGIDVSSPTRLGDQAPSAAAEINAELFEDTGRTEIGCDDLANRRGLKGFGHHESPSKVQRIGPAIKAV